MSCQVLLSDTFYRDLHAHLEALVDYALDPSEEKYCAYSSLAMYEHDTDVEAVIDNAFRRLTDGLPPR
jgi:hypothetical protein